MTSPYLLRPHRTYSQVALERLREALETALERTVDAEAAGVRDEALRMVNLGLQDSISDCRGMLARRMESERTQLFDEAS